MLNLILKFKCMLCPKTSPKDHESSVSPGTTLQTRMKLHPFVSWNLLPNTSYSDAKQLLKLVLSICKVLSTGPMLKLSAVLSENSLVVTLRSHEGPSKKITTTVQRNEISLNMEHYLWTPQTREMENARHMLSLSLFAREEILMRYLPMI